MVKSANLPAPYLGQDSLTPTAVLKSPYCERLFNFNTTEAGISLRHGDDQWAKKDVNTNGGVTTESFRAFIPYGASELFMCVGCTGGGVAHRYYNISTSGTKVATTVAHTSTTISTSSEVFHTQFGGRVFTYGSSGGSDYYDGAAWGASTYSFPGSYVPVGGCAFKNRQYFIFKDSSSYGYSEISAVTGAVTEVPLASILSEPANLYVIAPITISNEVSSQQLLAFVFSSGEVLFYSGSYPNGSDWGLVGSGNIDIPLNYNSVISPYRGDSLVATRRGLYSLRDLFLRGSQDALNLVLSRPITPTWTELIDAVIGALGSGPERIAYTQIVWWRAKNRLLVFIPRYLDSNGNLQTGVTYFIMDTLRGGWTQHRSFGFSGSGGGNGLIIFKDKPLYCARNSAASTTPLLIAEKEGSADFMDVQQLSATQTETNYDYEALMAPIPFPKTAVYETSQIEPILESDLYAETNYNLVVDFGRQTSGDQKTDAATTSVAKPAANVGMQNITFVQVKISGTTAADKEVGLELYSYNVWYSSGDEGSR